MWMSGPHTLKHQELHHQSVWEVVLKQTNLRGKTELRPGRNLTGTGSAMVTTAFSALLWEATSHLIKIHKSKDLNRKFNNRAVPVHLENLSDLRVGKSFPSMAVMEQRERKIKLQRNKTLHLNKLLYLEKVRKTRGSVWCVLLETGGLSHIEDSKTLSQEQNNITVIPTKNSERQAILSTCNIWNKT